LLKFVSKFCGIKFIYFFINFSYKCRVYYAQRWARCHNFIKNARRSSSWCTFWSLCSTKRLFYSMHCPCYKFNVNTPTIVFDYVFANYFWRFQPKKKWKLEKKMKIKKKLEKKMKIWKKMEIWKKNGNFKENENLKGNEKLKKKWKFEN